MFVLGAEIVMLVKVVRKLVVAQVMNVVQVDLVMELALKEILGVAAAAAAAGMVAVLQTVDMLVEAVVPVILETAFQMVLWNQVSEKAMDTQ